MLTDGISVGIVGQYRPHVYLPVLAGDPFLMDAKHRRERLNLLIDRHGQKGLADKISRSPGQVSHWVNGVRNIGEKVARDIEQKMGLPHGWFDEHESNVSEGPDIGRAVPLISFVRAGAFEEAIDPLQPGEAEDWFACPARHGPNTYALRVSGDSMTSPYGRSYPDSAIIFVDPDRRTPCNGDRVIAKLCGTDNVTFKVFVSEAGRCWLKPLNPQHPAILDPFRILGTVIGMFIPE